MNIRLDRRIILASAILVGLLLIIAGLYGCSATKADDMSGQQLAGDSLDGESGDIQEEYAPVKEEILAAIRGSYSGTGVKISSVEVDSALDLVKIKLSYSGKTTSQTVVAGFRILKDNYPKMRLYVVNTGGRKFDCTRRVLSYIVTRDCNLETSESQAIKLVRLILNGIPDVDADKPIGIEAI